ncbi:DNA-directed RNA polymerase subunit beta [Paenibacillus sp. WLX1005]|uniref:DNA-directed RNA polymerase subunit beta n=1 Tax=Paenibacillus sp. WLX1005 TaxID=3243766 RepID=UPI0039840255
MANRRSAIQEAARTQKASPNKRLTRRPTTSETQKPEKPKDKPAASPRSAGMRTLQFVLVLVGFAAAALIGMTVGYAMIGHQSFADVFYPETWAHIFELVYAP